MATPTDPAALRVLVDNRAQFLSFLERRIGNRDDAEDLLQGALVKALEKGAALSQPESAVAWVYSVLRNALVDRHRANDARQRAAAGLERQLRDAPEAQDPDLMAETCRCLLGLLPNLKPEYSELIRRVDLGGEAVGQAAAALQITAGNAAVRLHRARKSLLQELHRSCRTCAAHGCIDCTCRPSVDPTE